MAKRTGFFRFARSPLLVCSFCGAKVTWMEKVNLNYATIRLSPVDCAAWPPETVGYLDVCPACRERLWPQLAGAAEAAGQPKLT